MASGTTENGTWDFTLGLESSYLWGNHFGFETQNDVISKYYPGIPGIYMATYFNKLVTLSRTLPYGMSFILN